MANVGANGHWWSSSSYESGNINAGSFFCDASRLNPMNNDNRANGFSVRCVQHLREPVSDGSASAVRIHTDKKRPVDPE
ncbi:MAG: fibrobacter succinogenes major paralogous domain-containing protein [Alistipes sp.]|nr:fibrobacter succinogenes major paralogous domain-containing protein [Alistipes sp.]MDE6446664.1 fibrobacter succinogenes major paralogous domain-containing protein [Alistipes sp.]